MVRRRADEYRKDYAAQFVVGLREMHHIGLFLFDTADPAGPPGNAGPGPAC